MSRDGKLVATHWWNHDVLVWDAVGGKLLKRLDCHYVSSWCFGTDSKILVVGHSDGSFTSWQPAVGKKLAEVKAHGGMIFALAFSPDGNTLVTGGNDGTVLKWDAAVWQGK
jgi:WD40 repeat protein